MADRVSLLTALRRTARRELSINLFIAGKAKSIPADAALVLLADEPEGWDWEGTAQRVRTMWPAPLRTRHMPSRPLSPWETLDPLYKIGIPVLQPYAPGRVLTTSY